MLSIDFKNEVLKAAPVAATAAADGAARLFWGLTLNEWFYVAAIIYTFAQTVALLWRTFKGRKEEKSNE